MFLETLPRSSRKERIMVTNSKRSRIQVLKCSAEEKQKKRKKERNWQAVKAMRQITVGERKLVSMKYRLQTADWIQNADVE